MLSSALQEPPAQLANKQPGKLRYSEFLDAVEKESIEKVTFTSDGKTLTAIDTEGNRCIHSPRKDLPVV
jgi:hypothetical protein